MATKPTQPAALNRRRRQLNAQIKKHARGARAEGLRADRVQHAVECGRALSESKALLGHGAWNRWVQEECGLNRMTANRYVRLANRADEIKPNMTIREAYIAVGVITPQAPARKARRRGRRSSSRR